MEKERKRKSLIYSIIKISVVPILVLGLVLTIYGQNSVREGMLFEVQENLSGVAHTMISIYNGMDAGDFSYEDGVLKKGETDITSDYRLLDDIKNDTGSDVTIAIGNIRRLTTLVDSSGNRLVGTEIPEDVVEKTLGEGKEYFTSRLLVDGTRFYAYYVPIENSDGQIVGVSFAGRSGESVEVSLQYMIRGNVILCIFIIILAGFACNLSARHIADAIQKIKVFLGNLSQGDFRQKMPAEVLRRNDELSEIGEYAVVVSQAMDDMVSRDPLTQILNRRGCLARVADRQEDKTYTISICDIDLFKNVNDRFGHEKGDEVLLHVATALQETFAEFTDKGFAARWGGEEFVLGVDGDMESFCEILKKAASKIKNYVFECEGEKFHVTLTFGAVIWRKEESFEEAVGRADELLYYGKGNGRDQIVMEEGEGKNIIYTK